MDINQVFAAPVLRQVVAAACASLALAAAGSAAAAVRSPALKVAPRPAGLPCTSVETGPLVNVTVGKSSVMRLESPVARILLGNPDESQAAKPIDVKSEVPDEKGAKRAAATRDDARPGVADVDVVLLSPNEIYLLGKTIGSTNVVLLNRTGRCTLVDVAVGVDTAALEARLRQLLPGENDIKVSAAADSIVLTGMVADAMKAERAVAIASAYARRGAQSAASGNRTDRVVNMLSVAAPQQVMLEVKVAEVSKSLLDQLGASVNLTRTNGSWTYSLLTDFLSGGGGAIDATKSNGNFLTLDAQKKDGLVKILAEPNLISISGQEGSFLAGGKIFIPVSQTNLNGVATITLEEKEFGVGLRFTPTVLENGRINLRVAPEVSELSREGVGVTASGISGTAILPVVTTRRASTTVQLYDGQSFAIGGLIKNNVTQNIKALPVLGEVPVLGALFRSTDFQSDKSELVFVITPRLVKPLAGEVKLPTDGFVEPSRTELFLGGKMEGRKPAAAAGATPAAQQETAQPAARSPGNQE